jgi:hypothetical protein
MRSGAACAIEQNVNSCWTLAALNNGCGEKMQHEYSIRQVAKHEDYRLEKKGDGSYRLINEKFNVIVHNLDGVPLEAIESFIERRRANSLDTHHH